MEQVLCNIQQGIIEGKSQYAMENTKQALAMGISTDVIINQAMEPSFKELGERMKNGTVYITDVVMSSRAMHAAMHVLKPFISTSDVKSQSLIVIGTVAGDLHDIGKDLVSMALSGAGYNVIDLGIDVPKESFADAVIKLKPNVLALSALLTTTMLEMKDTVEYLNARGLHKGMKIIVGGAPVTFDFAKSIGADAFSPDMFQTIEAVSDLLHGKIGQYTTV